MKAVVRRGNLLDSDAAALVNTVNCVGVMGKGIAAEFKRRYPAMFADYAGRCARGEVHLGHPYVYRDSLTGPVIVNFPTKGHWKSSSDYDAIVRGLAELKRLVREERLESLAVPPLGCGNGGLEWTVVGPTIYRSLADLDVPVELYAPLETPDDQLTDAYLGGVFSASLPETTTSDLTAAEVALVEVVHRVRSARYHRPVGRVFFQKIAYFLTVAGIPTGLEFVKNSYGPFAAELTSVRRRLERNGLLREERDGNAFLAVPGPTFPDARLRFVSEWAGYREAIDRVVELTHRMTGAEAELAASVHFASRHLVNDRAEATELDVYETVLDWKKRRNPPIDRTRLAEIVRSLSILGWIDATGSSDLPVPEY